MIPTSKPLSRAMSQGKTICNLNLNAAVEWNFSCLKATVTQNMITCGHDFCKNEDGRILVEILI